MATVSLKRENGEISTFDVENNSIIFDALEDKGEKLPHGCLAGSCGSCRCIINKGTENLSPPGAIESNTIAHVLEQYQKKYGKDFLKNKIIRLSCRAKILGDIEIEPIKEKL